MQDSPEVCTEFWWGWRRRAVQVDLGRSSSELLAGLLEDAWEQKAPAALARRRGS